MLNRPPGEYYRGLKDLYSEKGIFGTGIGIVEYSIPSPYDAVFQMVREERKKGGTASVPLSKRVAMYRLGFQSYQYRFYGFDEDADPEPYLSEFHRVGYTRWINDDRSLLDNKAKFHELLSAKEFDDILPEIYGRVENGILKSDTADNVVTLLSETGQIVIKPVSGAAGSGVRICTLEQGEIEVNGNSMSKSAFRSEITDVDASLVTEYCEQAEYSDEIYPGSANTIRVLTMQPEGENPFVAIAVQRIGSDSTGGLDNFSQGGLSAEVDLESGQLSAAAEYQPDSTVSWHTNHPDTGADIQGLEVPGWPVIKGQILEVMDAIPELRYVGWDVLVTEAGEFVLLEGNNHSDVDLLQIHRPLLAEDRTREFYREQGVPV